MENKTVKIVPSAELFKMKLKSLVGRTGIVVAKGERTGYWVELDKAYQNEKEWFIPNQSLQVVN